MIFKVSILFLSISIKSICVCGLNNNNNSSDPCSGYTAIEDFQRSTAFKYVPNSFEPCDRPFSTNWYRFTSGAGGKIPTTNPPPNSCGVKYPVWFNGSEPTAVGDEKTGYACGVVNQNPCANPQSLEIKVKKCLDKGGEFFVYYLKALSGCPMRYCAGSEKCEPNKNSSTSFTPLCSSKYPKMDSDPVVSVGVKDKRVRFSCKFSTVKDDKARYEVTWYQGPVEKQIKGPEVYKSDQNEAFLQNNNKFGTSETFCMGYNIYCKVQSYYDVKEAIKSPTRKSNEFFAGFQVNPKSLDLSEKDKPKKVTITSTVPIVCEDGTENCRVLVELGQTKTDSFVDHCTVKFKPGPAGQSQEVEVVAKRDFIDDGNQKMFLKLFIPDHVDPVDWNCHKQITDVEIKTFDVKTSRCTSNADPHITTFDQFYYNHFQVGDFVLVQSTARNFKVHARTFKCSTVSCNCGVAAQEGDDVVVIDMCRDNVPRARFASTVEPQSGTSLTRNNNGKSFMISFPSGAYVKFDAFHWFGSFYYANIQVQVPSDDYQSTQGLCGTFDNNRSNEMVAKNGQSYPIKPAQVANQLFSDSWKLNASESLFYFKGGPQKCAATRAKTYCTCSESCCRSKRNINCDYEGFADRPKYIHGVMGWKKLEFPGAGHCGRRKRRSMDEEIILPDDGNTGVYDYIPSNVTGVVPSFPTESGIDENQAKNECKTQILNSAAAKACIEVIGSSFETKDYEDQCVLDIKVTDSVRVGVESAINNLISACEELTLRNLSFWMNAEGNITGPPAKIAENVCPNECNGNGTCVNATCICNKGFITADCSLKEGQPPVLFGIQNSGLCDIQNQDCIRTRVMGKDFVDSSSLSCKMTEVEISDKPHKKVGSAKVDKGDLLSFAEISCLLPTVPVNNKYSPNQPGKPVGGYAISVSNNRLTFSDNETLFVVYDSKCMECTSAGERTCKWKDNSCKINEYCFAADDFNPRQWCEVCNPSKSRTAFSKRTNNIAPYFTPSSKQYAFKGQQWKYMIPAHDPENQPLTYEFIVKSHGMKISSDGILTWSPDKIGKYLYTIKVSDPCGLSASATFEVETMQCYCEGKNDGICDWQGQPGNLSSSICQCPRGCTGELCTQPIDGLLCKIKIKIGKHEGSLSKAAMAGMFVALVLIVALFIALTLIVLSLKKQSKKLNIHNIAVLVGLSKSDSKSNKSNFSNKADGKIKIDLNGEINEGFVKEEANTIEKRIESLKP